MYVCTCMRVCVCVCVCGEGGQRKDFCLYIASTILSIALVEIFFSFIETYARSTM